jgi:hypothetical protein
MLPADLKESNFAAYPPMAARAAREQLSILQQMPLCLAPVYLRELIATDVHFPAERRNLTAQFRYLQSLDTVGRDKVMAGFRAVSLPDDFAREDWVNHPQRFMEKMTAYLWSSHQIEQFQAAARNYGDASAEAVSSSREPQSRVAVVALGRELVNENYPLFRKLRPNGVFFAHVEQEVGFQELTNWCSQRAAQHAGDYAHWYIDGGEPQAIEDKNISRMSWQGYAAMRSGVTRMMTKLIQSGTGGPEILRTQMADLTPADAGVPQQIQDTVMDNFVLRVFTEGSGTQIFSTTFAQWSAREALRRAEPATLLVRYAARQKQQPMNEMLEDKPLSNDVDPAGSLVDADMGAYYTWLNLQRLPGKGDAAGFLAWSEAHQQAVAIGAGLPRGTVSSQPVRLSQLLKMITPA